MLPALPSRSDEVRVVRLDRKRTDEAELRCLDLLGERVRALQGGGGERVDRRERAGLHLGRHPGDQRINVDDRPDPAGPGDDQLAERLDGLGTTRVESSERYVYDLGWGWGARRFLAASARGVSLARRSWRGFRDPFASDLGRLHGLGGACMPTTVEEIQAIVRIANEQQVPLWTHGQGGNNGYGGPAPRVKGSVIVSLRKMNRVLEIDEESRVRGRRAGRSLVRPVRGDPGRRSRAACSRAQTSAGAA